MALVATATVVELTHIKRPECTLSNAVRAAARVNTPLGRYTFTAAWGALAVWFWCHVMKEIADAAGPQGTG